MIAERKTNRSSTSRQSSRRPSNTQPLDQTASIPKANFVADFLKLCTDYGVFPLPEFHIIRTSESSKITSANSRSENVDRNEPQREGESDEFSEREKKSKSESVTVFSLIYDDQVRLESPKDLRCRGSEVNLFVLDALINCAKKFTTLTTLKLQRCSINANGISRISEILAEGSGCDIKDLNLDINPNMEQNFHLLCAPGTSLIYLSLKLCEINDYGVGKIASNLYHRDAPLQSPKLIVLNLSNNRISETGGKFIGNMLRTNRSLQSLTLTGNRINDAGAECIIGNLSTLTLTHAEVVEKRRRKMNRLKLRREKMDNMYSEAVGIGSSEVEGKERGSVNRVLKKRRASSRQVISNSSESSANRSTPAIIVQSLEEKAEAMIPPDTHPLVKDSVPINGALICPGNFKLQHLNLSFNKIGEDTLQRVIDCVIKQESILKSDVTQGLQHIDVIGNEFEKSCDLALQLNAAIHQRRSGNTGTKIGH